MRILTMTDLYPPDMRGGAEIITRGVVDGLRQRGHEVVVATGALGPAPTYIRPCLEYHAPPRWQGGRAWLAPWQAATEYRRAFHNRRNEAAVTRLLAEVDPQVVYVGGISGVAPCSILRALRERPVPVVVHLHEYWLPNMLQGGGDLARLRLPWLKRRLIGLNALRDLRFTSMVAVSRSLRDRYVEAGFSGEMIEVFPYGLPPIERQRGPALDGELRLLFVGRLDAEKGAHLLLERLAVVAAEAGGRRIWCDLAGPPGPPAYMRRLHGLVETEALRGRVRLLGSIQRETMLRLYARYDAVVVPSLWQDPCPAVVPEAMAAGAAVVASRWAGSTEWFEDGHELLLFSPDAPEELDHALRRLRDEPELAQRLAEAGNRKTRQVFDQEKFIDRLEQLLEGARGKTNVSPLRSGGRWPARAEWSAAEGGKRAA